METWSCPRRGGGKAEWLPAGANPRFVVTSLSTAAIDRRDLYETLYCARGDMENRIKECQLDLFADRTSAQTMRANQLRLWFAAMAYVLLAALRRIAPGGTTPLITVPLGQLDFEWRHLIAKLEARVPAWCAALGMPDPLAPHPLFRTVPGGIADWERP